MSVFDWIHHWDAFKRSLDHRAKICSGQFLIAFIGTVWTKWSSVRGFRSVGPQQKESARPRWSLPWLTVHDVRWNRYTSAWMCLWALVSWFEAEMCWALGPTPSDRLSNRPLSIINFSNSIFPIAADSSHGKNITSSFRCNGPTVGVNRTFLAQSSSQFESRTRFRYSAPILIRSMSQKVLASSFPNSNAVVLPDNSAILH